MIHSLIQTFYQFMNNLGYTHPIHPTQVHIPIGLLTGACVFGWIVLLLRRRMVAPSARHCFFLAFVWFFPTVFFGLVDWQHFYRGAWLFPIKMKLTLASILLVLLFIGTILREKGEAQSRSLLTVYTLCFLTVVGLGYFGGQLAYGGKTQPAAEAFKAGEGIFTANCSGCHPHGGNAIEPDKPIINSPKLKNFNDFLAWIRKPEAPMPPFSPSQVSDEQAQRLYRYITQVLVKSSAT